MTRLIERGTQWNSSGTGRRPQSRHSPALAGATVPAYAELAIKYPRAAGAALYVRLAFDSPLLTFLVGACVLTAVVAGAATAARAFADSYLAALVDVPVLPAVIGFVLLAGAVALRGITESTRTAVVLTVVELLGLLLVVAVGVAAVLAGTGDLGRAAVLPAGASPLPALIGAAGLAVFVFTGFDQANQFVEETRNPTRAFPLALYGARRRKVAHDLRTHEPVRARAVRSRAGVACVPGRRRSR